MLNIEESVGKIFNGVTVLGPAPDQRRGQGARCRCHCGKEFEATLFQIRGGDIRSCGCAKRGPKIPPVAVGADFDGTVVLAEVPVSSGGPRVRCRCRCGNEFEARWSDICRGRTSSCGCHKRTDFSPMVGRRFGLLVVTGVARAVGDQYSMMDCRCDCGNEKRVRLGNLRAGNTRSCGCQQLIELQRSYGRKRADTAMRVAKLVGRRFGRLVVEGVAPRSPVYPRKTMMSCRCDCGRTKTVPLYSLKGQQTRSCGCLWQRMVHLPDGSVVPALQEAMARGVKKCTLNARTRKGWTIERAVLTPAKAIRYRMVKLADGSEVSGLSAALLAGVTKGAYYSRLKLGWTAERAASIPLTQRPRADRSNWVPGLTRGAYYSRLRSGWSPERAAITPVKQRQSEHPAKKAS